MMAEFSYYIMPTVIILIIVYGLYKRTRVFDAFTQGAKKGLRVFTSMLPSVMALIVGVNMLDISGGMDVLKWLFEPFATLLGMPKEAAPIAVISPLSGSGSLSVFENILSQYGADSFIGRVSAVMMGSSETTFYAIAVYYGSVGIKQTRHTVAAGLFADFVTFSLSAVLVRIFFC